MKPCCFHLVFHKIVEIMFIKCYLSLLLQEFEEPGRPNVQTSVVRVSGSSVKIEDSRQDFVTSTQTRIFLLELT